MKWNKAYNLTAVRERQQILSHHLLDSLSVLPHLFGTRIADIGSGAGLPGIPLAIAAPANFYLLVDSNGKKTRFLVQAVAELGLPNVEVFHGRSQDYPATPGFDTVVCRALASLPNLISMGAHLLTADGVIVAQKGQYPATELENLPAHWDASCTEVSVPLLETKDRHIVKMRKTAHLD